MPCSTQIEAAVVALAVVLELTVLARVVHVRQTLHSSAAVRPPFPFVSNMDDERTLLIFRVPVRTCNGCRMLE